MIDCFNEDEVDCEDEDSECASVEVEKAPAAPTVSTEKAKVKAAAPASPSKAVVEYIVDQKGAGSESLVVKSSGNKNVVLSGMSVNSSANGSRRGSLVSPRRSLPQRPPQNTQTRPTTHTHPLFPNYSRGLPTFDAQVSLAAVNADLGLAALNVADFSLNAELWSASAMFPLDLQAVHGINYADPYAVYASPDAASIPRYAQQQQLRPAYMESTQGMNTVVSDLFSDVSMF